jgi:hypothetical protein
MARPIRPMPQITSRPFTAADSQLSSRSTNVWSTACSAFWQSVEHSARAVACARAVGARERREFLLTSRVASEASRA